jgi:hypothetical protein
MVRAIGISQDILDATDPGRLCRGRERWIEPLAPEGDAPHGDRVARLVLSGAAFSDDAAADALRGLEHGGIGLQALLETLFPGAPLLAFAEDAHPADIPEGAVGVEAYDGWRAGGAVRLGLVRWYQLLPGADALPLVLGAPPDPERVRGFAVLDGPLDDDARETLLERLFWLVGFSTLDSPPARFQPEAIPAVLALARALVLLHRDKHGLAVGIYTERPLALGGRVDALAAAAGSLVVPFAIPPMLARWDRALAELRVRWMAERTDEFPVPPAPEPPPWERRGRRGRGRLDALDLPLEELAPEPVVAEE